MTINRFAALTENSNAGSKDINSLRKTFLQITNSYTGITGNTSLDEAGYRKYGDYDFWAIVPNNDHNAFEWKKVGVFKSDANTTYGLTLPISKKLSGSKELPPVTTSAYGNNNRR